MDRLVSEEYRTGALAESTDRDRMPCARSRTLHDHEECECLTSLTITDVRRWDLASEEGYSEPVPYLPGGQRAMWVYFGNQTTPLTAAQKRLRDALWEKIMYRARREICA